MPSPTGAAPGCPLRPSGKRRHHCRAVPTVVAGGGAGPGAAGGGPGGRIATPPFDDGSRISVDGVTLRWGSRSAPITTVRAAAEFLGVEVSEDPGVGRDLPPLAPDEPLPINEVASRALGEWYAFGQE